jgi:hypothetical protein
MSHQLHDTSAMLEARPSRPHGETRVVASDFMAVMRMAQPAPAKLPPAESGGVDAARIWQDAISGRAPQQLDAVDRVAAAASWRKMVDTSKPQAGVDHYNGQREVRPVASVAADTDKGTGVLAAAGSVALAAVSVAEPAVDVVAASEIVASDVAASSTQSVTPAAEAVLVAEAVASPEPVASTPAASTEQPVATKRRGWGRK